jgi:NADH:ubiquinone oxidoreductase subunit E
MTDDKANLLAVLQSQQQDPDHPRNILSVLQSVQQALGYIPADANALIASHVGVTEAGVDGVLSFYPDLRRRPLGRHLVRVCMGESCVANRSSRILTALAEELRIGLNATTADGRFTLERVYCVGNCAVAPSLVIDEDVHGRVDPAQISSLLDEYR